MRHTENAGYFKVLYYSMMKEVSVRRVLESARKEVTIKLNIFNLEDTSGFISYDSVKALSTRPGMGLGMRLTQLLVRGHVNLLHVNLIYIII